MDDPIDALLGAASCLDWISPLMQFGQMAAGAEALNVYMPGSGMTGHEVAELLRQNGVKVGPGGFVHGDYVCLTVSDCALAVSVLAGIGIEAE
jgi:hypothetical protein